MTDPRNIAHDKKVAQEKKPRGDEVAPGAEKTPQPEKNLWKIMNRPHKLVSTDYIPKHVMT